MPLLTKYCWQNLPLISFLKFCCSLLSTYHCLPSLVLSISVYCLYIHNKTQKNLLHYDHATSDNLKHNNYPLLSLYNKLLSIKFLTSCIVQVKVVVQFKGREMQHKELGRDLLQKIYQPIEDIAAMESPPKVRWKIIFLIELPWNCFACCCCCCCCCYVLHCIAFSPV
jgi:Translation initiation factor IF-3, C-terminal domain